MNETLNILIVDDNQMMVKTLQDIFRVKGYQTEAAYSGLEALAKLESGSFDCVLSDIKMPNFNGVELYQAIKVRKPDLPVILMTAYATDSLIDEGLAAGVVAVLSKPLDVKSLLNFFSYLSRQRSVVIVDDDPLFCCTLADILEKQGFVVRQITDPEGIVEQLKGNGLVVLLDMKLKQQNGLEILHEIKTQHPGIPVILVTGYQDQLSSALEVGLKKLSAHAYFSKPLPIEQLLQTLNQIHHQKMSQILGQSF